MVRADIGGPGAIALFEPKRFNGPVTGISQTEFRARLVDRPIDGHCIFHRQMQFPAQLSHIGHPKRIDGAARYANGFGRGEWKAFMGQVVPGDFLQNRARLRSEERQNRVGRGHIHQLGIHAHGNVLLDVIEVMGGKTRSGNNVIFVFSHAHAGQIAFNAAGIIEHLGIDQRTDRLVDITCGDPRKRSLCIGSLQNEFCK